jgi:hypothetical protein
MPPVFHDNHLMRFVPLLPSLQPPQPWRAFPAVELAWQGGLHPDWARVGLQAPQVHAIHLPAAPWDHALGAMAMAALRPGLDLDFLVLQATVPGDRMAVSSFMTVLEGLLELTHGTGVKLALRPGPGAAPGLLKLLDEARGEAVGFCWDAGVGEALDQIAHRLYCAVGAPGDAYGGLQRLGYRWNLALPAEDPQAAQAALEGLAQAHPTVLFPADLELP